MRNWGLCSAPSSWIAATSALESWEGPNRRVIKTNKRAPLSNSQKRMKQLEPPCLLIGNNCWHQSGLVQTNVNTLLYVEISLKEILYPVWRLKKAIMSNSAFALEVSSTPRQPSSLPTCNPSMSWCLEANQSWETSFVCKISPIHESEINCTE